MTELTPEQQRRHFAGMGESKVRDYAREWPKPIADQAYAWLQDQEIAREARQRQRDRIAWWSLLAAAVAGAASVAALALSLYHIS